MYSQQTFSDLQTKGRYPLATAQKRTIKTCWTEESLSIKNKSRLTIMGQPLFCRYAGTLCKHTLTWRFSIEIG